MASIEAVSIGETYESWKPDTRPSVETEQENVPPAFDLAHELKYIQQLGDSYYSFFNKEALYYIMETYGRVPKVVYQHSVLEDDDGNVTLYIDALHKTARESYQEPVSFDAPEWYTKRAEKDYRAVLTLEQQLKGAQDGDVFLEVSPTEYDIDVEERKKCGFGYQSFVRVHQLSQNEQGEKILISRALREYLDQDGHVNLFKTLTGTEVNGSDLLGTVVKLRPDLNLHDVQNEGDILSVQNLIDQIYESTPETAKIVPPEEDLFYSTNQRVKEQFDSQESWLKEIFVMLREGPDTESVAAWQAEVERQFHGWETALKTLIRNDGITPEEAHQLTEQQATLGGVADFRDYFMAMEYSAGSNSCGNGSGFGMDMGGDGASFNGETYSGSMSYGGMTGRYNERMGQACSTCGLSSADNHYHCPGIRFGGEPCNKWYDDETDIPHEKRTKKCSCGFTFNC
ncbi:MAG: hypothetical protein RI947_695 [Candidatus Parcubacteria bacterium]|jgi:hypothetical protein